MSSKTEEIISSIRSAVAAHRLLPGVQLREVGLGKLYGVSRTVVRQALQTLAREGLVDLTPGKIASVAKPTPDEARDTFDLRWAIEQHATQALARRLTKKDVAALRAHVKLERAARAANDVEEVRKLGAGFHILVAQLAGNALLTRTLEQLTARIALILLLYRHEYDEHVECLQDEHSQFVDLLESGAVAKALKLLQTHLQKVEGSLQVENTAPVDDPHLRRALF
ncbi:MAG: GntR family transcriptional regulator [Burkholderiales bacterium]|nr:MAG: GntR family transcriptional regulator [Burkholderiales bacterium]